MTTGSFLDAILPDLAREHPTRLAPGRSAGVAVMFRISSDGDEEVLLIRRAERDGDPWSGQVAFPGGMVGTQDGSFEETARRETLEEVGLDLSRGAAVFLGYMGEFEARTRKVAVVPSVFKLIATSSVELNREVASFQWASLKELAREEARSTHLHENGGAKIAFPSLVHRGLVIWGLTERILSVIIDDRSMDDGALGKVERY